MLKVAMIGFGGIAQSHRHAYWYHNKQGMPIKMVAACDTDPSKFRNMTVINIPLWSDIVDELPFNEYTDWKEMLEKEKPDLVDICLPTKFHNPIAIEALKMGYNVFSEKPMAENYEQCLQMIEAAKENNKMLMIGHCVRFSSKYEYLKKAVDENLYGKVVSSEFFRYSPIPTWGGLDWRAEAGVAGSCIAELNVHDVDYICSVFGNPEKLSCVLESKVYPYDFGDTVFYYKDHTVKIKSAWFDETEQFRAGFVVNFEKGTLELKGGKLTFTDNNGNTEEIDTGDYGIFMAETKYFMELIMEQKENTKNPPEDSANTIYALERMYESAAKGAEILEYK